METLFLDMPAWQVFLAIGVLLSIAEIVVPGFILLPIGLGFAMTAPVAALTNSLVIQLAALTVFEIAVFFLVRKFAPATTKPVIYSNAEGMIGQECEVIEEISATRPGYVKLYGDRWQAKTFSTSVLVPGSRAIITKLDGNKVHVEPLV